MHLCSCTRMPAIKLLGAVVGGINGENLQRRSTIKASLQKPTKWDLQSKFLGSNNRNGLRIRKLIQQPRFVPDPPALSHEQESSSDVEKKDTPTRECLIDGSSVQEPEEFTGPPADQSQSPSILREFITLSLPAIAGQVIEPLAQLMGTAYVGRLGVVELAAAGLSLSIFSSTSKLFNIPLLGVATSFVAEEVSLHSSKEGASDQRKIFPSVSTALALSLAIGLVEAAAMIFGSGKLLNLMGVAAASPIRRPAEQFLRLRAIGAPAVVVSLAVQGIFRGFKDTRTPVLCLGIGNFVSIFFFPVAMYTFRLGITGAAISTLASQYIVTILLWRYLDKKTVLQPSIGNLNFSSYLKSGGFLVGRTISVAGTMTLATSTATHLGAFSLAAHQICLQVWLFSSLLVEAQSAAGQALIASSFAKGEYSRVKDICFTAIKTGLFTGMSLAVILGSFLPSIARLFTRDPQVLGDIRSLLLLITVSQPLTALAYIFDGIHNGVLDFSYSCSSMMISAAVSCSILIYGSSKFGLHGVWFGLNIFMGMRAAAGFLRLSSKNGPWWFLHDNNKAEAEIAVS